MTSRRGRVIAAILVLSGLQAGERVSSAQSLDVISDWDFSELYKPVKVDWGLDPFHKIPGFAKVPKTEPAFNLTGIVFNKDESMAIINNNAVSIGDAISGWIVVEIQKGYVILKRGISKKELTLAPPAPRAESGLEETEDSTTFEEEFQ